MASSKSSAKVVKELKDSIRDKLANEGKGRMMKEGLAKMRHDELQDLERRNVDLRQSVPPAVLSMKFSDYMKTYKEVPTLDNVNRLFSGPPQTSQPVRGESSSVPAKAGTNFPSESVAFDPPPAGPRVLASRANTGPRVRQQAKKTKKGATSLRTPVVTPGGSGVMLSTGLQVVPTPGGRPLRAGEAVLSSRGSLLGVVRQAETNNTLEVVREEEGEQ